MPYADPQKRKEYQKEYRIKNKSRIKERLKDYHKKHYPKNREKILIQNRRWRTKNAERMKTLTKEWNKNYGRNKRFKTRYGITAEEYDKMYESQKGICAICGVFKLPAGTGHKNGDKLVIDHNHFTTKVRSLLCSNCNIGLGLFRETKEYLLKAIAYLESHNV